jgi:single-strand DNA-binding protein
MLNHIVIMGRLTRDPELRYTQAQVPVASFTVAVDRDFGGRDGGEKQTDFIDCSAWRQTGEFVSKYFRKGSMIVVSGRLQSRKWQDRDGNNRTSWEISADNVYFGESRRRDDENRDSYGGNYSANSYGGNSYESNRSASAPAQSNPFTELGDDDGELPF